MKTINFRRAGKTGQTGFTIIELVVVILLLGILAATALPRFMDVTTEAHSAAVDGLLGGLSTAAALYRAEFIGKGGSNTAVPSFPGVTASATTGYPNITTTAGCVTAFNGLLQGGRPTIVAGAGTPANSAVKAMNTGQGVDYVVNLSTSDNYCVYSYIADVASGINATKNISWNHVNSDSGRN